MFKNMLILLVFLNLKLNGDDLSSLIKNIENYRVTIKQPEGKVLSVFDLKEVLQSSEKLSTEVKFQKTIIIELIGKKNETSSYFLVFDDEKKFYIYNVLDKTKTYFSCKINIAKLLKNDEVKGK